MLGAERLLADREGALVKQLRPRIVALGPKQVGEVVEAQRRMGMLGAERIRADRQSALVERPRARIGGSAVKIHSCPVQKVGTFRVRIYVSFRLAVREEMRRQRPAARPCRRTVAVTRIARSQRRSEREAQLASLFPLPPRHCNLS